MPIDDYNFLKLLDEMIKKRINKYSQYKDNEDWKSHWDKVYQEIVTKFYQELKGKRASFFSVLGRHAININFKRREADFLEENRLRRAFIKSQAHNYTIEKKEKEDDDLGIRYGEYDYAKNDDKGCFIEKSNSSLNKLPVDQCCEKEIYEIAIDLLNGFKKDPKIDKDFAVIAEHFIFGTDKEHGQHVIVNELVNIIKETPDKIRAKKFKMKKEAKKVIFNNLELDLGMAIKSMGIKRKHADKMKKQTDKQVAGAYIPTPTSAKVIKTNICSINQLMDDEIREFEKLYCCHAKSGRKAGLDRRVGKAIDDRPKSNPKRGPRTSTKKPSRSKVTGIPSKPSTDDAA